MEGLGGAQTCCKHWLTKYRLSFTNVQNVTLEESFTGRMSMTCGLRCVMTLSPSYQIGYYGNVALSLTERANRPGCAINLRFIVAMQSFVAEEG